MIVRVVVVANAVFGADPMPFFTTQWVAPTGSSVTPSPGGSSCGEWMVQPDAGWSLGWVSALDIKGRTIWIVDAHGYGKRFVVHADDILTAFLELETAIHEFAVDAMS